MGEMEGRGAEGTKEKDKISGGRSRSQDESRKHHIVHDLEADRPWEWENGAVRHLGGKEGDKHPCAAQEMAGKSSPSTGF